MGGDGPGADDRPAVRRTGLHLGPQRSTQPGNSFNDGSGPADGRVIPIAPNDHSLATAPTARTDDAAVTDATALLARSLRGDDWLGSSGPAEFVVLLSGPASVARTAARRLVTSVAGLAVPGLSAAAGIAPVVTGLSAGEVLRRATLSLTAGRRVWPGTVIEYREPLS